MEINVLKMTLILFQLISVNVPITPDTTVLTTVTTTDTLVTIIIITRHTTIITIIITTAIITITLTMDIPPREGKTFLDFIFNLSCISDIVYQILSHSANVFIKHTYKGCRRILRFNFRAVSKNNEKMYHK